MARFRIITAQYNWSVNDNAEDATVFLSDHFYKSPITGASFVVLDKAIINLDKIVAIEKICN